MNIATMGHELYYCGAVCNFYGHMLQYHNDKLTLYSAIAV
jgi:hypothetical protein